MPASAEPPGAPAGGPQVLVVPARLDRLAAVRGFVRAELAAVGAEGEAADDLVQAVDESVTNVIEHGYAGASGEVQVELSCRPWRAIVRIRDAAPAFDPTVVPAPDTAATLAERPLGGMGVHLARVLTDEMSHRILPGGGNELTLVKMLAPRGGGPDGDRD